MRERPVLSGNDAKRFIERKLETDRKLLLKVKEINRQEERRVTKNTYNCPDCLIDKDMFPNIDICSACSKVINMNKKLIPTAPVKQWVVPYDTAT